MASRSRTASSRIFSASGYESAGIGAWNTPGPFTIRRNLIQAAGVNFLFGGADPSSSANTPADILIEDNEFSKKLEWRGRGYAAKNLGEFKNARRVIVRNNLFRYSWAEGQTAYGLVLAVRNQDGGCPYCIVEEVLIEGNTIQDVGTAVSILGRDTNHPSQTMRNVTFRNNIFDNINKSVYGGRGTAFEILKGPERLTIEGTQVVNTPLAVVHSALFFGLWRESDHRPRGAREPLHRGNLRDHRGRHADGPHPDGWRELAECLRAGNDLGEQHRGAPRYARFCGRLAPSSIRAPG